MGRKREGKRKGYISDLEAEVSGKKVKRRKIAHSNDNRESSSVLKIDLNYTSGFPLTLK
jgi:hypothetical protein